jgi:hypothetical protein
MQGQLNNFGICTVCLKPYSLFRKDILVEQESGTKRLCMASIYRICTNPKCATCHKIETETLQKNYDYSFYWIKIK